MTQDTPETDYETALSGWFGKDLRPISGAGPDEDDDGLLGGGKKSDAHFAALERVKGWVRERFKLAEDSAIVVSEITCQLPGCPPLETAVAFWEGETRHHFKLLRPVAEVEYDQLPYAWQKASLAVPDGFGCECC